jgi:hypothetical protein
LRAFFIFETILNAKRLFNVSGEPGLPDAATGIAAFIFHALNQTTRQGGTAVEIALLSAIQGASSVQLNSPLFIHAFN